MANSRFFAKGQVIFRQDEPGGELFFVSKGKVEVRTRSPSTAEDVTIAYLGENSILGTMSFLEGDFRSATAVAIEDVECMAITSAERDQMLKSTPKWCTVLLKDMSRSIRRLNDKYARLVSDHQGLKNSVEIEQLFLGSD